MLSGAERLLLAIPKIITTLLVRSLYYFKSLVCFLFLVERPGLCIA